MSNDIDDILAARQPVSIRLEMDTPKIIHTHTQKKKTARQGPSKNKHVSFDSLLDTHNDHDSKCYLEWKSSQSEFGKSMTKENLEG